MTSMAHTNTHGEIPISWGGALWNVSQKLMVTFHVHIIQFILLLTSLFISSQKMLYQVLHFIQIFFMRSKINGKECIDVIQRHCYPGTCTKEEIKQYFVQNPGSKLFGNSPHIMNFIKQCFQSLFITKKNFISSLLCW